MKIFPKDFIWAAATSSYQVEGAAFADGKGLSIWDKFAAQAGNVRDDRTANVSSDQYHHYKEDIQLMKDMGLKAYRLSLSWPRIFPTGRGEINGLGIDYYKKLCDELLANNIEPYVTLYHWDLPLTLQEEFGGWESKETVKYFGDYASKVAQELGARVKNYFTINEFFACSDVGYSLGLIAPGLKLSNKRRNQIRHNVLLAHGIALEALRANAPHAKISIAENPIIGVPIIDSPEHTEAGKKALREINAPFLTAIMEGKYLDCYLEKEKADAPIFTDAEMRKISAPMDFLGLNIYYGSAVMADKNASTGYKLFEAIPGEKSPAFVDTTYFEPASLYWGIRLISELWTPKAIMITENGLLADDRVDRDGNVYDTYRINQLRCYLSSLYQALDEGYPITGYFVWSFLDVFEWHYGYRSRYGLYYINYETGERIPKLSAQWYKKTIANNRIL
ncbi:MAG: family 1 glycosylhydrolase [Victivallaceae bacterium]